MAFAQKRFLRLAPAVLLGLAGLWVVVQQLVLFVGGSGAAAAIGMFRGDLWAVSTQAAAAAGGNEAVLASASRWAAVSPLSSEAWLAIAGRLPASEEARKREALAMAFAAGPGEVEQMPRRLALAAGSAAITDGAVEQHVRRDIGYLLKGGLRGENVLRDIDRQASPLGRYRLRAMFVEISPAFAASLPAY